MTCMIHFNKILGRSHETAKTRSECKCIASDQQIVSPVPIRFIRVVGNTRLLRAARFPRKVTSFCSGVLPTSWLGYFASKPVECMVYCLHKHQTNPIA